MADNTTDTALIRRINELREAFSERSKAAQAAKHVPKTVAFNDLVVHADDMLDQLVKIRRMPEVVLEDTPLEKEMKKPAK